ncbi:hypothetical protein GOBAR_DD30025 [Gossypium barbadense]|nr:hypothetical protein GOBAR_DD30025 [Gossypium barbadense]
MQTCRLILRIVIAGKCSLDHVDDQAAAVPPTNAFLLIHCRSVPAKSWSLMEEENRKVKESFVVMKYDHDFYKISSDIAQETWLVGGMKDHLY